MWLKAVNSLSFHFLISGHSSLQHITTFLSLPRELNWKNKNLKDPKTMRRYHHQPCEDFTVKRTSPKIPAISGTMASAYGLVEQMHYLYVRIVGARNIFPENSPNAYDSLVEVRLGDYRGVTTVVHNNPNPQWNQVFAFSKDRIHSSFIEISLRKKSDSDDGSFMGRIVYDVNEAPKRVPPDSALAPQWYKLDHDGLTVQGDLMVAIWFGTQADEAFSEAWHSDSAGVSPNCLMNTKSKVYLSPKLWYLRVNVIQAQDVDVMDKSRRPEVFVRGKLGDFVLKTKISQSRSLNPMWDEDLLFVAAEPFEECLALSVEERFKGKEEVLGRCVVNLKGLERRLISKQVDARWYCLEKDGASDSKFNSKIHLRMCLDGGYHVLDETTHNSSDLRPTVKQLWRSGVGVLELGILNAFGLPPMKKRDDRGTIDAYCVAKYGQKWVRTRTIVDNSSPQWNEQYTWEVFDPCTVLTIGVFDNTHLQDNGEEKDTQIGKVRIRLSTLETDRIYTFSYPLIVLNPHGVKKNGEIQLSIRFTCTSFINLLHTYSQPILPRMHYLHPLSIYQLDYLRHQATRVLAMRLGRSEPPLRTEVVQCMLGVGSHLWSTRRSRANCHRIRKVAADVCAVMEYFDYICSWRSPFITVLIHILLGLLILYPRLIMPFVFAYFLVIGVSNYRKRETNPPHMNVHLSYADRVHGEELDEEFDTFPTSKGVEVVRARYDRLRGIAGRVQTVAGDVATQGERLQALLNWRDRRATALFMGFCGCACVVLWVVPMRMVVTGLGCYVMRHPTLRSHLPSTPMNFFRRLPAKTDCLI